MANPRCTKTTLISKQQQSRRNRSERQNSSSRNANPKLAYGPGMSSRQRALQQAPRGYEPGFKAFRANPDSPLNQKILNYGFTPEQTAIARMVLDPAHLIGTSNGPLLPALGTSMKAACRVEVQEFNIDVSANAVTTVYSTPFWEVPVCYRFDDAPTQMFAIPSEMGKSSVSGNPCQWLKDNNVYAWKTTGKSITISNVTADINKGGNIVCARFPSCCDFRRPSPSGYNLDGTLANNTSDINQRVIQSLPGSTAEVSKLPEFQSFKGDEGVYMISKFSDREWKVRQDFMHKAFDNSALPAVTDVNCTLMFNDINQPEGGAPSYVTYQSSKTSFADGARCVVSEWDSSDICAAAIRAPSTAQTYTVRVVRTVEYLPKLNSTTFNYELKTRSTDIDFLRLVDRYATQEIGFYPASFNGLGTMFKKFTGWVGNLARSGVDFYKSHPELRKAIGGVSPVAKQVMEVVDNII